MLGPGWRLSVPEARNRGLEFGGRGQGGSIRALLIPCVALCSLALSGCSVVYTVHPLNNSDDAVDEPALVGKWKPSSDDVQLSIQKSDHNTYTMLVAETGSKSDADSKPDGDSKSEKDPKVVEAYRIALVRLEDQLFADMVATDQWVDGTRIDPPAGSINHHVILKLKVTDSDLAYSALDSSNVREAKKAGLAPWDYLEIDDGLLLTASTEELRSSVSHYADLLFTTEEEHFSRVTESSADGSSPPCPATPTP